MGARTRTVSDHFQTETEAAHAMQTIVEREERYETEDSEWNGDR